MTTAEMTNTDSLLAAVLSDEGFFPSEPRTLEDTGLAASLVESLIAKHLAVTGTASGRAIADAVCLPLGILEPLFQAQRSRQIIVQTGSAPLNDFYYALTEQGRERAQSYREACATRRGAGAADGLRAVGRGPDDPRRSPAPREAGKGLCRHLDRSDLVRQSRAGGQLRGRAVSLRRTGQWQVDLGAADHGLLRTADLAAADADRRRPDHQALRRRLSRNRGDASSSLIKAAAYDRRWVKVRRPTVVVGGELTMDGLEIRHDPVSNTSEAPLQLKSNCGCLLIDDFGRQRIEPKDLLNRWIVPLESRQDFLTLSTGKKIKVPFEQLIIFSTNLEPQDLVDEAFLRRIPYKIQINDPDEAEFHHLFELYAVAAGCEYRADVVDHLLRAHYRPNSLRLRRCHPRDLLGQVRNYCAYNGLPMEMRPEYFDRVVKSYFTVLATALRMHAQFRAKATAHEPVRRSGLCTARRLRSGTRFRHDQVIARRLILAFRREAVRAQRLAERCQAAARHNAGGLVFGDDHGQPGADPG